MTLRLVVWGGSVRDAWLHRQGWAAVPAVSLMVAQTAVSGAPDGGEWEAFERVLADRRVDAIDLPGYASERISLALAALEAGKHVVLTGVSACEPEDARRLIAASRRVRRAVVGYEPWLAYPPVDRLRTMIRDRTVGRVSMVRMRSLLAGRGGWDPAWHPDGPVPADDGPETNRPVEIGDKLALAESLLGPIESVHALQGRSEGPRTTVVSWKHRIHGGYGVLELTEAPDMMLRSRYDSRDDVLELTGSAGIIWMTRGPGQLRQQPTIQIYRGADTFAPGDLDDDWLGAHQSCAGRLAVTLERGKGAGMLDPDVMRRVEFLGSLGLAGTTSATGRTGETRGREAQTFHVS